jgi:hypothetical protein
MRFTAGAAATAIPLLTYHVFTWQSFTAAFNMCVLPFCDFADYYYPMGEEIFRTGVPVKGFLYSPFNAILLAVFPLFGLSTSFVLWGTLQVLAIILYILLFRRLVPAGLPVQLLFVGLTLSSFPLLLNFVGGSVTVFMMVGILGLLVLYESGRFRGAAALLAFASSFKFYPLLFFAPFAARRDRRFLFIAAAASVAFLFVIPAIILGYGETIRFYAVLLDAFRASDWVVANPHSQYFPHILLRLTAGMGYDAHDLLPLLRWFGFGIVAANMGLLLLVQRARLRHAGLWSFQLVFLTIPFALKTSWPHDFVYLTFAQALLAWRLVWGEKGVAGSDNTGSDTLKTKSPVSGSGKAEERNIGGEIPPAAAVIIRSPRTSAALITFLLLPSIIFSNIVFFNIIDNFPGYGALGFLFIANMLLLIAMYIEFLPGAVQRLRERQKSGVHPAP